MFNQYFDQVEVTESGKRFIDKSLQIGDEIVRLLEEKSMTQRQLAEALGKKESQVSKWLTGFHNFTLKTITEIEDVLGEDILLPYLEAKKRFSKTPVVLHQTVVRPEVYDQLRDVETNLLVDQGKTTDYDFVVEHTEEMFA
ncbi:helix-turn-helix transcriptional regulator [Pontibacter sp. HSC-14F20]|uniref:helix-turn-helix domain-containing protein n=1 Tax=Pontibacter sp. HSC-14F20 TaxID=2864136 RepID=UPI001C731374|nr:helix-turn-helix transcriptional regulator [Pontibacter sp. HSC-14F20]MBX0334844.1 helix-turn-helix transcriptional regulator [Pontibacter sp. HSC-14F20]